MTKSQQAAQRMKVLEAKWATEATISSDDEGSLLGDWFCFHTIVGTIIGVLVRLTK